MGSVKGTEGDAEASGNQPMDGGSHPCPKAEGTREGYSAAGTLEEK